MKNTTPSKIRPYQLSVEEVFSTFNTSANGLSDAEALKRKPTYGENVLSEKQGVPMWIRFLEQFKSLLAVLLIAAAVLSLILGGVSDALILSGIVVANAILGFIQEFKSEKILENLKKLIVAKAKAVRSGKEVEIAAKNLVPGDVISVEEGDQIPADVRLFEMKNFSTTEFALTGESMAKSKTTLPLSGKLELADKRNMAFMGTTVSTGNALAVVVATGMHTEVGTIASLSQEIQVTSSPLQVQIDRLAKRISFMVLIIQIILIAFSLLLGKGIIDSLILGIAVAASCVPEGLPAQISIALSLGAGRLAKSNALVKKLASVEALGSTTVICTDKTGTLTKNEMTVRYLWTPEHEYSFSGIGYESKGKIKDETNRTVTSENCDELSFALKLSAFASNAKVSPPDMTHQDFYAIGDPTEAALIVAAQKALIDIDLLEKFPEVEELSFDSDRKSMTSLRQEGKDYTAYSKGAPNRILDISKYILDHGVEREMTEADRKKIQEQNDLYATQSLRILGLSYRKIPTCDGCSIASIEQQMVFVGLVAMQDPPRTEVPNAIHIAKEAHIRIIVITGDHPKTAEAIGKAIGLYDHGDIPVFTGDQLDGFTDDALSDILKTGDMIFSRVSSKDKLRIVSLLQTHKEVVAVTGDGVNDAPALKKADIGIAMGRTGTDVAKEAAQIILLDDSFSTIVMAIQEGRNIFHNLKKTIYTSLTSNFAELFAVLIGFIGIAMGYPAAILAVQILAIDLIGEMLPLTALTWDDPDSNLLKEKPRSANYSILTLRVFLDVGFVGLVMGIFGVINYFLYLWFQGSWGHPGSVEVNSTLYHTATTITYFTIILGQFANLLSRRNKNSAFQKYFFSNTRLWISFALAFGLIALITLEPHMSSILGMAPIPPIGWALALAAGILVFIIQEIKKWILNKMSA